ncbi:SDH family Clp fold serine proteinase [Acinetobacter johnsonii]|uniref:SDH family Clp fold serine proteinase n=1 Tax=Acinetobacter johnsonii TaxID=40214 RepID=UPI00280E1F32|nr:ATP-dependent Clp protease proteolytic subunit [Acinetobacter johnsonii]MDQ8972988.1 ATP-dependent Clp protease proteolytic subunit [Acinetobacter johnsonii]
MTTEKTTISQKDPTNKSKKSTQNSKKKLTEAKKSIEPIQKEIEEVKYDLDNIEDLISLVKTKDEHLIKNNFSKYIDSKFTQYESLSHYELVFLYDRYDSINTTHSNNIYKAITNKEEDKDILMFLLSDGGKIEPAYLISKACKRLCKDKFVVTIPRRAKSAATLIALGASEIHMGLLSELGPIDPQINGFPALGLTNALEKIASLSDKFPKSSDMFAKYLTDNLSIKDLGYFERINESAVQYATRLLEGKNFPDGQTPHSLANHFTNHYKDHSFVIDVEEALKYFGNKIIKENSLEYLFSDFLHNKINFFDIVTRVFIDKKLKIIGSHKNLDDIILESIEKT